MYNTLHTFICLISSRTSVCSRWALITLRGRTRVATCALLTMTRVRRPAPCTWMSEVRSYFLIHFEFSFIANSSWVSVSVPLILKIWGSSVTKTKANFMLRDFWPSGSWLMCSCQHLSIFLHTSKYCYSVIDCPRVSGTCTFTCASIG